MPRKVIDLGTAHGVEHGGATLTINVTSPELTIQRCEAEVTLRVRRDAASEIVVDGAYVLRAADCQPLGVIEIEHAAAGGELELVWSSIIRALPIPLADPAARVIARIGMNNAATNMSSLEGHVAATIASFTGGGGSWTFGYRAADGLATAELLVAASAAVAAGKLYWPAIPTPITDLFSAAPADLPASTKYLWRLSGLAHVESEVDDAGLYENQARGAFGFSPHINSTNIGGSVWLAAVAGRGWAIELWSWTGTLLESAVIAPIVIGERVQWQLEVGTEGGRSFIRGTVNGATQTLMPERQAIDINGAQPQPAGLMSIAYRAAAGASEIAVHHAYGRGMLLELVG